MLMYKSFFVKFISLTLSALFLLGGFVFILDPFSLYRCDENLQNIIHHQTYYQNTGIAKNAVYDTLITGSSMVQNFRANWFNEKTGSNAVRLPYEGGTLINYLSLIDIAIKNNTNLKCIYYGLDNYVITRDSKLYEETNRIPNYLIDDKLYTDINYWLNKDVLFRYTRTYFGNKIDPNYNFYDMQAWQHNDEGFSKQDVLKQYSFTEPKEPVSDKAYIDNAKFAASAIAQRIKANPQIEFILFAPPYSILYWHELLTNGKLDATIVALKTIYQELLQYDNVRMFYFQNNSDLITNLDKYCDISHYHTDYNKYMLDCFISGKNEITKENYIAVLDNMKDLATNYDYDAILNN